MTARALTALALLLCLIAGAFGAPVPDGHSSRISLDWNGTYRGVLPCADCAGIETVLTLRADGSYRLSERYLEEDPTARVEDGTFHWNEAGSAVALGDDPETRQYQVGENVLFQLDRNGERIRGDLAAAYELLKDLHDPRLEGREWQLVALGGEPVATSDLLRTPTLHFDADSGRVGGSDGCNRLMGSYTLHAGQRLALGPFASTRMACPGSTLADAFGRALTAAEHYRVDGDELVLLAEGEEAPLARLRASNEAA